MSKNCDSIKAKSVPVMPLGLADRLMQQCRRNHSKPFEAMVQRPGRFSQLRDRPYLIACAVGGVLLVVLVIAVVSLIGPSGAGVPQKAAAPASPAVATPTVTIPLESPPPDPAKVPFSTTYTTINGCPAGFHPVRWRRRRDGWRRGPPPA